ncbi:MAG: hypothetical protein ACXVRI_07440, partial [Gaiellaceae bacterium]
VLEIQREELEKLGPGYEAAAEVFGEVALADEFAEFLTLPAYERLATIGSEDRQDRIRKRQ